MARIDIDVPEYCARCPLMVVHRETDFMPTFLCKIGWKELNHEYICKKRAEFCPFYEEEQTLEEWTAGEYPRE